MPTKETSFHYSLMEIIDFIERKENKTVTKLLSIGMDGLHVQMEELKPEDYLKNDVEMVK